MYQNRSLTITTNIKKGLHKIVTTVTLNKPFSGNLRETVKLE